MNKEKIIEDDRHFFGNDGICSKCGWSMSWAQKKGTNCPVSSYTIDSSVATNEESNFNQHRFINGFCFKCGWSYSWSKKKSTTPCPVASIDEEYSNRSSDESSNFNRNNSNHSNKNSALNKNDELYHAKTLGLTGKVSKSEIKKAYRDLSKKYHPDRVNNLGEEFIKIAEKRMKEINSSYSWFKDKYQF